MELKVPCDCGQKFKFEVEPVNGLMPFNVSCPACGVDATAAANGILSQSIPAAPALATAPPPAPRLQMARPPELPAAMAAPAPRPIPPIAAPVKATGQFNLGLGIVGGLLGAALGAGLVVGFAALVGFRFPLPGFVTGILTGYGARILGKGSDQVLGLISAVLAVGSVVGALFLMYTEFPPAGIISVIISGVGAYRIATR